MADKVERDDAGATEVALTDEKRQDEDAKRLYDRAVIRFSEADEALEQATNALRQWKADNAGYDVLDARLLQLKQDVNDADQRLQNADRRLQNADRRLQNARAENATSVGLSTTSNLQRLGVAFSIRDVNYLFDNDIARYQMLKASNLTRDEAIRILATAKSAIKSATRNAIGIREGFFLNGVLTKQGQSKSCMYYAYSQSGGVLVAKVYTGYEADFQREVDVNFQLEAGKNVVKFIKSFSIENATGDQQHIIIMPFFPRSASDLLTQHSPVSIATIGVVIRDCAIALGHIHSKKYCYADLKPSNIMLEGGEVGRATLVDFGGAIPIGTPVIEISTPYCLDVDTSVGSEKIDWVCLGTTVAQLAGFDVFAFRTAAALADHVSQSDDMNEKLKVLIRSLLLINLWGPRVAIENFLVDIGLQCRIP